MASRATLAEADTIASFPHGASRGRCALSPWVGFDMDHTLVRYQRPVFDTLVYATMAGILVKEKGYPKPLLHHPNVGCLQRGLVIDKRFGIVVKLDWSSQVTSLLTTSPPPQPLNQILIGGPRPTQHYPKLETGRDHSCLRRQCHSPNLTRTLTLTLIKGGPVNLAEENRWMVLTTGRC